MNVYIQKNKLVHYDLDLIPLIFDSIHYGVYHFYDFLERPLKENSLFLPIGMDGLHEVIDNMQDIKTLKNKKILILNHNKCFSNVYGMNKLENFAKKIVELNFEKKDIYFITQLNNDTKCINKFLNGINVMHFDRWLHQLFDRQIDISVEETFNSEPNTKNIEIKKFCIFVRRFEDRRFEFYCNLLVNGLLDECHYTFANYLIHNLSLSDIKMKISSKLESQRQLLESWIDGMPYTTGDINNEYTSSLKKMYQNSKINIVFETDPVNELSFITEKTYKAIWYKKPFILISQPHALKILRENGYLTFSPYIDESYDDIEDYDLRSEAILNEIIRLNNLPNNEFDEIVEKCSMIVNHNHKILCDERTKDFPKSFTASELLKFE